ncbi:hypothetical protein FACS189418_9010 [Clostridia bacterium]|nr:hypothetical protein FACS189418_9010 [Clostridia bacterium]
MSIFENLGKTITHGGKKVAQTAKTLTGVWQLKAKVISEKNNIEENYKEIGKKYFEANKSRPSDEFKESFEKINTSFDKITQLEQEIHAMEKVKVCPSCNEKVSRTVVFCPKCGAKQEETTVRTETTLLPCQNQQLYLF